MRCNPAGFVVHSPAHKHVVETSAMLAQDSWLGTAQARPQRGKSVPCLVKDKMVRNLECRCVADIGHQPMCGKIMTSFCCSPPCESNILSENFTN